jgi:hypothetical protein
MKIFYFLVRLIANINQNVKCDTGSIWLAQLCFTVIYVNVYKENINIFVVELNKSIKFTRF